MATPSHLLQTSTLPPAQPTYILRGHTAQIHCVHFLRRNLRLLTGDADGWVVLWNLPVKRPVAVWKPHGGSVLGVGAWGTQEENVVTHGRDNKLLVWQLRDQDEAGLSKVLPIDDAMTERKQPWLLHSLDVNALNFCSFAMCPIPQHTTPEQETPEQKPDEILLAYPGVQDGLVNLTSLPTATRIATLPAPPGLSTGMLMAVSVHYPHSKNATPPSPLIAAGYESGHVALWRQQHSTSTSPPAWKATYITKPHAQPVLSIAISPDSRTFYSSSADAVVAWHPITFDSSPNTGSSSSAEDRPLQLLQTKHAGQQALAIRSDNRIFATAGWDGRVRVYSTGGSGSGGGSGSSRGKMKELAVLKWHKEGCYAAAFGEVVGEGDDEGVEGRGTSVAAAAAAGGTGAVFAGATVSQRREAKTQATHWLAAGSKDGKVSLWDIY